MSLPSHAIANHSVTLRIQPSGNLRTKGPKSGHDREFSVPDVS
jgi:hypothetical protein